jgi:hypothetical protein
MDVGSWTDHGSTGVKSGSDKPYNAIDPNLINVGGTYYLTWGSFWKDIYQAQMKATSPLTLASGVSSYQLAYDPTTTALEGAYIFKYGSYYYLFYSKGQCCGYDTSMPAAGAEYKILVCRSTSATSGYVDKNGAACTNGGGTVVLESHGNVYGPGGQGVYQDPTYGPVSTRFFPMIVCLAFTMSDCWTDPLLPLRRQDHWLCGWRQEIWLEYYQLFERMACRLMPTRLGMLDILSLLYIYRAFSA